MHRTSWPLAVLGTLLAVSASACSGGSSGSSRGDAATAQGTSVDQLCGALTDFQADLASAGAGDPAAYAAQLKAAATRLEAVGLPDEMPADARAGFTQQLDLITALPETATEDDLAAVGKAAEDPALETYLAAACPDLA